MNASGLVHAMNLMGDLIIFQNPKTRFLVATLDYMALSFFHSKD